MERIISSGSLKTEIMGRNISVFDPKKDARARTGASLWHRRLTDDRTLFPAEAVCKPSEER